jgi:hypothetical protein
MPQLPKISETGSNLVEIKVCSGCEKPWPSDQKSCSCGHQDSTWVSFNPLTREIIKPVARIGVKL